MQETQRQYGKGRRQARMRRRVSAAFQAVAHAVDRRVAHAQTKAFYRSGRGVWTRGLS